MDFHAKRRLVAPTAITTITGRSARPVRLVMSWLACAALMGGCGSGGPDAASPGSSNTAAPVTKVTLVLSSDASDRYTDFGAVLQGITLTNSHGKSVTLLSQSFGTEFVHLNGLAEPLITATLPQDIYTAAIVTVGRAEFTCVTLNPDGGVQLSTFDYDSVPANLVSVSLPEPLSVTGDSMVMTLRMLVQPSASLSSCSSGASYAIRPTFTLASSSSSTVLSLEGAITTVGSTSKSFELQQANAVLASQPAPSLRVSTDDNTVLQGLDSLASLSVGAFVDLDGQIQADGSVRATRLAVADPTAVNVRTGPILSVLNQAVPVVYIRPVEGQGPDSLVDVETYDTRSTTFHISGQLPNVQELPFTAAFDATNMVPGQNISLSSPAFVTCCGVQYFAPATTLTLMPQTIDGPVLGTTTSGSYTVYTVELPDSSPFVALATQPGQAMLLRQPNQVQVYVDSRTRMLNSNPVVVGSPLRFYGLVFNDNGVLRMDCAQINDGVRVDN